MLDGEALKILVNPDMPKSDVGKMSAEEVEPNSEPHRTRTCNRLIKSQLRDKLAIAWWTDRLPPFKAIILYHQLAVNIGCTYLLPSLCHRSRMACEQAPWLLFSMTQKRLLLPSEQNGLT